LLLQLYANFFEFLFKENKIEKLVIIIIV